MTWVSYLACEPSQKPPASLVLPQPHFLRSTLAGALACEPSQKPCGSLVLPQPHFLRAAVGGVDVVDMKRWRSGQSRPTKGLDEPRNNKHFVGLGRSRPMV